MKLPKLKLVSLIQKGGSIRNRKKIMRSNNAAIKQNHARERTIIKHNTFNPTL